MNYVVHYCKNKKCNNAWIDKDLTNAKSRPPQWKYCEDCCKKYGYKNLIKPELTKKKQEQLAHARCNIEKIPIHKL